MANTFAWILATLVFISGIVWLLDRIKLAPARRKKLQMAQQQSAQPLDAETQKQLTKKSGFVDLCVSVFPVLAIVFVIRSFIYEPFQIPSGSMMPTLLVGDFILVEKFSYGIKNPLTQSTIIETGHPKRGDIAVFKYPQDPKLDYIKRVIGMPGDKVVYDVNAKQLTVYPACGQESCENPISITYDAGAPSEFVQEIRAVAGGEESGGFFQTPVGDNSIHGHRLTQYQENIGDVAHRILVLTGLNSSINYYRQPGQPAGQWVVPEGHYFMMGDNRDNSADSRYWGFVPERNLVGKATAIWMSFEKQPGEWPTGVRLSRIGGIH